MAKAIKNPWSKDLEIRLRKFIGRMLNPDILGNDDPLQWQQTYTGTIPLQLRTTDEAPAQLTLVDDEVKEFKWLQDRLAQELPFETLKDKDRRDHLWWIVCEVFLERKKFRKDSSASQLAREYLSEVAKPVQEYVVMIPLSDLSLAEPIDEFWGAEFHKLDQRRLLDWMSSWDTRLKDRFVAEFGDKDVISLRESGNNPKLVGDRARSKAHHILRVLKFYLSHGNTVDDIHLLFNMREGALVIDQNDQLVQINHRYNHRYNRRPFGFTITDKGKGLFVPARRHYKQYRTLPKKITESLSVALNWYGLSIEEENYDIKIVTMCTAFESLLTTISDKRKGEAIACRYALLSMEFGALILDLDRLLRIYELRSRLVHGATLNEATRSEYSTLQWVFREAFDRYLEYVSKLELTSHSAVCKALDRCDSVGKLLSGLEKRGSKGALAILEFMKPVGT